MSTLKNAGTGTAAPVPPMIAAAPFLRGAKGDPPISDVNTLSVVGPGVALQIKHAAGLGSAKTPLHGTLNAEREAALPADSRGKERWPVKTGQDLDRAAVGKNVISGKSLGAGIVETTVEELSSLPRPPGLQVLTADPPAFLRVRDGVAEVTIWRVEAVLIAIKHEQDGDYHLVLQGKSGAMMVAEIPTPDPVFVGDSPWLLNIGQSRKQIDQRIVSPLDVATFSISNGKYVPTDTIAVDANPPRNLPLTFVTPEEGSLVVQPLFATRTNPTPVRLTGVGFFDRAHGATGSASNVIELHPVLEVEWQ